MRITTKLNTNYLNLVLLAAKVLDHLELWDSPLYSSAAQEALMKSVAAQKNLISTSEGRAVTESGAEGFLEKLKNIIGLGSDQASESSEMSPVDSSAESFGLKR